MALILVVCVHPSPNSFTRAWAEASLQGARGTGHQIMLSDLYADEFDPVDRPGGEPPEAEIAKLKAADHIVFHFPLWWYGPPAILKGWVDRVLVPGDTFDVDAPFERGPLVGKRALFCVSAGVGAAYCGPSGRGGDARLQLWPLAHALRFAGIEVLEPYVAPGIDSARQGAERILMEAQIAALLSEQPGRIAALDRLPVWASNPAEDFDENGALKPGARVYSPFIRHDDGSF